MSITIRWRLTIALLAAISILGAALVVLLALGLAGPPRVGVLRWQANSIMGWPTSQEGEVTVHTAPVHLGQAFTLEITAANSGPEDSAWGFQLLNAERPITLLVSNDGYFSTFPYHPSWQEFLHIRPHDTNRLSLSVSADGQGIVRINDEIAHDSGIFDYALEDWGIATYRDPHLTGLHITLYHQ